jgi:hypothetical protein
MFNIPLPGGTTDPAVEVILAAMLLGSYAAVIVFTDRYRVIIDDKYDIIIKNKEFLSKNNIIDEGEIIV